MSQSSENEMQELFSQDSSDIEEILEIERDAILGDQQDKIDQEMAEQELKTNIESRSKVTFSSGQEVEVDGVNSEDVGLVLQRMGEVVRVLNQFNELREEGR